MTQMTDVVILGGGPAGLSAAIWCRRLGLKHLLLEQGRELGGQLHLIHNEIIDYPGLLAANGLEVKQVFEQNVRRVGCELETGVQVLEVDVAQRVLWMQTSAQRGSRETTELHFRSLILATGSAERRLQVPGEQEMLQRGEVYSASRDRSRLAGKKVAVVGGGDRAFEGALLLAESGVQVTLIHRSQAYRARAEYRNPVLQHPGIVVLPHTKVMRIEGDQQVTGVEIQLPEGVSGRLDVEAVLVRVGVEPNSQLLRGQVVMDQDGYLQTDDVGQTSAESVLAIGDVCTRPVYSSIAKAVGQGMTAAKRLSVVFAQRGGDV